MENQDNLFNKIKSAAENAENQDFPTMEKIWSRIDAKLDTKVEQKNTNNWKKLLVAASILLVTFIGYQFLKDNKTAVVPETTIVKSDTNKANNPALKEDSTAIVTANPIIKKDADKILEKQISSPNTVAIAEEPASNFADKETSGAEKDANTTSQKEGMKLKMISKSNTWKVESNNPARGVVYSESAMEDVAKSEEPAATSKKQKPLVLIDDELRKGGYSSLNDDEIESLVELPEPVYFINGVEYSEEELFGDNPTSPYAPLSKQNIVTISVLQPEKAIPIYGKKGEKGIVIITTKDGKPKAKK
jgi:hypothetical protein